MKRLDKYVGRDLVVPFIAATIALAAIFMLYELIGVVKQHFGSIPPNSLAQLAILAMPKWLVVCLPGGLSLSVGLVVSRLMRESEMTALRSAGVSISRVVKPIVVFSCAMAAFSYVLLELIVPAANQKFDQVVNGSTVGGPGQEYINNQATMVGPYLAHFQVIHKNPDNSQTLEGIFLYRETNDNTYECLKADMGNYRNGTLSIDNAAVLRVVGDSVVENGFKPVALNEPLNSTFNKPHPESESISHLVQDLRMAHESHTDTRFLEATFYQQIISPMTCILFAVMSAYSSVRFAKIGAFVGLFASSVWPWLYFNVEVSGLALAKNSIVSPIGGTWGVLAVFCAVAFFLVRRVE